VKIFDINIIPEKDLVLLTTREIDEKIPFQIADFRDHMALVYVSTGDFIGYSKYKGIRLGQNPKMTNGIWILDENKIVSKIHADIKLNVKLLDLRPIS
jgi:hypothetical protein